MCARRFKGRLRGKRARAVHPYKSECHFSGKLRGGTEDVFGMWLVWILGGLGVFFFGGLLGIGDWAYFSLLPACWPGRGAAVNRILERLRDLDKRLQQLQAQLDRLTQGLSSEEPDEPG